MKIRQTCRLGLHDRVYDHSRFIPSDPPKQRWICRFCGTKGMETVGLTWDKVSEYDRIEEQFAESN